MLKRSIAGLLAIFGLQVVQASELAVGSTAPAFALQGQDGSTHALSDFRGRWVVLYFYPKNDTPGCTTEACNFRDDLPLLRAMGVQLLGVSVDDRASHARFAKKYELPFPLLADTDGAVARSYGALWSLGPVKFARRHSFIIDPQGQIARIYRNVQPSSHSREIRQDLQQLQAAGDKPPTAKQ